MIGPLMLVDKPLVTQEAELGETTMRVFETIMNMFPIIRRRQITVGAGTLWKFLAARRLVVVSERFFARRSLSGIRNRTQLNMSR
jgi:hypothetical protein